jgi:hypothetical protein
MTKQKLEEKLRKRGMALMDSSEAKKAVNYGLIASTALTVLLPGGGSAQVIKRLACKTMKGLAVTHAYQHRKEIVSYFKKLKDSIDKYKNKP